MENLQNTSEGTPGKVSLRQRVEAALDKVRPALQADGGDAEIIDISSEGVVTLQLMGACGGCAMSMMTLKGGIERVIRSEVPEITAVEAASNY
jgi:Fe-S cluster biogenesis protein NfuA